MDGRRTWTVRDAGFEGPVARVRQTCAETGGVGGVSFPSLVARQPEAFRAKRAGRRAEATEDGAASCLETRRTGNPGSPAICDSLLRLEPRVFAAVDSVLYAAGRDVELGSARSRERPASIM